LQFRH